MKLAQDLEPMFTREQIAERVRELGSRIERDYQGKELVLLGVLKGSYIFISDLARAIDLPLSVEFLHRRQRLVSLAALLEVHREHVLHRISLRRAW